MSVIENAWATQRPNDATCVGNAFDFNAQRNFSNLATVLCHSHIICWTFVNSTITSTLAVQSTIRHYASSKAPDTSVSKATYTADALQCDDGVIIVTQTSISSRQADVWIKTQHADCHSPWKKIACSHTSTHNLFLVNQTE